MEKIKVFNCPFCGALQKLDLPYPLYCGFCGSQDLVFWNIPVREIPNKKKQKKIKK